MGIGDRDIDIKAAKGAGIVSCYYNFEGMTNNNADYDIKELKELRDLIGIE